RHEHPPVANRYELGHAPLGLFFEQRDRVPAVRRRLPLGVSATRRADTRGPPSRRALRRRGVVDAWHTIDGPPAVLLEPGRTVGALTAHRFSSHDSARNSELPEEGSSGGRTRRDDIQPNGASSSSSRRIAILAAP